MGELRSALLRLLAATALASVAHGAAGEPALGLGSPLGARELAGWDIDVAPDGKGLPPGSGTAARGKAVYETACAACHGAKGEGKPADRLVGGQGTLGTAAPVRTIGSFWPYATTLYDYVYRAMPFNRPQSLSPDDVYAVIAYLLFLNGVIASEMTVNADTLPRVAMPNRSNFVVRDPRPDVANIPCLRACR